MIPAMPQPQFAPSSPVCTVTDMRIYESLEYMRLQFEPPLKSARRPKTIFKALSKSATASERGIEIGIALRQSSGLYSAVKQGPIALCCSTPFPSLNALRWLTFTACAGFLARVCAPYDILVSVCKCTWLHFFGLRFRSTFVRVCLIASVCVCVRVVVALLAVPCIVISMAHMPMCVCLCGK